MRIFLLIFLVFLLPATVYWAANGARHPADAAGAFARQLRDLKGPDKPDEEP